MSDHEEVKDAVKIALMEQRLSAVETQLKGIKAGLWAIAMILFTGVSGYFFSLLASLGSSSGQ